MEKKVCSYTEPNHRLQLLKIGDVYEIRYNRSVLKRDTDPMYMRQSFLCYAGMICIQRQSPLLFLTS